MSTLPLSSISIYVFPPLLLHLTEYLLFIYYNQINAILLIKQFSAFTFYLVKLGISQFT
jgi:hypothetical protein